MTGERERERERERRREFSARSACALPAFWASGQAWGAADAPAEGGGGHRDGHRRGWHRGLLKRKNLMLQGYSGVRASEGGQRPCSAPLESQPSSRCLESQGMKGLPRVRDPFQAPNPRL